MNIYKASFLHILQIQLWEYIRFDEKEELKENKRTQ